MGNINGTKLIDKWVEDCVIHIDTSWEFAQASTCLAVLDFEEKLLEGFETNTSHLHKALSAKFDYDRLSKYFLHHPEEGLKKTLRNTTRLKKAPPQASHQ